MAKDRKSKQKGGAVTADSQADAAPARPKVGPLRFLQQVRQEVAKVTWPTRNETTVTTIMVFIMVTFAALFFLLVDQIFGGASCRLILNTEGCTLFGFDI